MLIDHLPDRWGLVRTGGIPKLLYTDVDIKRAIELIVYNIGVDETLDIIPTELIEEYLKKKEKQGRTSADENQ
jgi:hypothetical protein